MSADVVQIGMLGVGAEQAVPGPESANDLDGDLRSFIDEVGVVALSPVTPLSDVLDKIAKMVAHRLRHKYCSIQLYDPNTTYSRVEGYYGFPASHISETNRLLAECWKNPGPMQQRAITLTAVADRQTVAVEDILHSDKFLHARELAALMDYASVIAIPLELGSECSGVLWCCDDFRTYDPADRRRLEIAAKYIALIIELVRPGDRLQAGGFGPPKAMPTTPAGVLNQFVSRFMGVVQLKDLAIQPNRLDQLLAAASAAVGFPISYSLVAPVKDALVHSPYVDNVTEIALADECYGYLVTPDGRNDQDFGEFVGNQLLLQLIASYCAFQRRTQLGTGELSKSYANYLLRGVLGYSPISVEERRSAGPRLAIGMADHLVLISVTGPDGAFATRSRDVVAALMKRRVITSGYCATVDDDGRQILVLAGSRPVERGELQNVVRRLANTGADTGRAPVQICVSRGCVGLDAVADRARELEMCRQLEAGASPDGGMFVDDYPILQLGFGVVDDPSFIARAERSLRELLRPENAELERTLRMYLACDLGKTSAAQKLYIHINTLKYRLKRVEELTGLSLSRVPDLVQIQMFLLVHDLRRGGSATAG
jgi:hypothetical protein